MVSQSHAKSETQTDDTSAMISPSYSRRTMLTDIKLLLANHDANVDLLRQFYDVLRKRFSIRNLARQIGIASSGHMAAIVNCENFWAAKRCLNYLNFSN